MPWMPLGWVAASGAVSGGPTFELISTTLVGSAVASVSFTLTSAQQAAYKHLQLRAVARDTAVIGQTADFLTLNGDTGANYAYHRVLGSGSGTPAAYSATSANGIQLNAWSASTSTTNAFGASIIDILDAFNTSKNKTTRSFGGNTGTNNEVGLNSGVWMNTAAISSVTITANVLFLAGSRFSLYGVRG
jgi:hypothetical protein